MSLPSKISASRGAAVLGLSPYQSMVDLWLWIMSERKNIGWFKDKGYEYPQEIKGIQLDWGHGFESAIIKQAERIQDDNIIDREKFITHPKADFITCHLDGVYKNKNVLHEGKTTSAFYFKDNFGVTGTDKIPINYQIQVQHQMMIAECDQCIVSVLVFPKRVTEFASSIDEIATLKWSDVLVQMGNFHQYIIPGNKELQNLMLNKYNKFWDRYVIGGRPPEPESYDDIKKLVQSPIGSILSDEKTETLIDEYKMLNAEISDMIKRKDQIKKTTLQYMNNQDSTIEEQSRDKWILKGRDGKKLISYNGKTFR